MVYKGNTGVNQWKIGMFWTPCENPLLFLFNCCCAPCGAYRQRERLLGDQPYYCCMGAFPCLCLKNPCDKIPFLCLEVACCTICAVTANRAYIQRTKGVVNDRCDNCLIWMTCICQWLICCLQMMGQPVDPSFENAVDCFYYIVVGCMLTQQDLEIDPDQPGPAAQTMTATGQPTLPPQAGLAQPVPAQKVASY